MTLAQLEQQDWGGGMYRGFARHLIPANGAYDLVNTLLDEDGLAYRRGGTVDITSAAFGSAMRWVWAGYLLPGERVMVASPTAFGVLDSAGTAIINLSGSGLSTPVSAVEISGLLFIGGGTLYGGSLKTADYSTGTIAVTNGSKTVTGTGTAWNANVDVGMLLQIGGSGRYYVVESVGSDASLSLHDNFRGSTASGLTYSLTRLGSASAAGYPVSDSYIAVADRLLAPDSKNKVPFSDFTIPDPADANSGQGPHKWSATDFHELPEGVRNLGGGDSGSLGLIFTTRGVFAISGLSADLTDPQGNTNQRVERVHPDIVLWSNAGIARWQNSLVVPALDGAYLIDGVSRPERLSASIPALWRDYVDAGYRPGKAEVHRADYLLPILDSGGTPIDLLVCRLDRPIRRRTGPTIYPWSHLTGTGGRLSALARRIRTGIPDPTLLGAENSPRARLVDCTAFFMPSVSVKRDADGTDFTWELVTRDLEIGRVPTQTKRVRIDYLLKPSTTTTYTSLSGGAEWGVSDWGQADWTDSAATVSSTTLDNASISAAYSIGDSLPGGAEWGISEWGVGEWTEVHQGEWIPLNGQAPTEPEGNTEYEFPINTRSRRVRLRFREEKACAEMRFRALSLSVRPSAHH